MFDLDQSVSTWRAEMAAGGSCAGADLDELESHLRDSVARLSAAGLSADESFLIAVRRLGGPDDLRPEYGKAHPERLWRDRAVWMLAGLLAWGAIRSLTDLLSTLAFVVTAFAGSTGRVIGITALACDLFALILAVVFAMELYRHARDGKLNLRPGTWVLLGVLAIILGHAATTASNLIAVKHLTVSDLGTSSIFHSYAGLGLGLLVPVTYAVLVLRLHRRNLAPQNC